jgi:phage shock protein PspC (stress-responsive transcriptional regulator)
VTLIQLFAVVAGVVAFGIGCYLGIHVLLSEVESERLELKNMHCGRWL